MFLIAVPVPYGRLHKEVSGCTICQGSLGRGLSAGTATMSEGSQGQAMNLRES